MSKLGRLWDRLLPGLICLCPMGAIAFYIATAETEAAHPESERAGRRGIVSDSLMRVAIIPVARI